MTATSPDPAGLLTPTEREQLTDSEVSTATRNEIRGRACERLSATLRDIHRLYPTLREADIETVFAPADDRGLAVIRTATQDALALLIFGMLANDDHVEMRLSDAIRNATLDYGEDVTVDLTIRRGPFPTVERCLDRFETEGMTPENLALFERLLFSSEADADQIAVAAENLGIEATPTDVTNERESTILERLPQTAVVGVDGTRVSEFDPESSAREDA